MLSLMTARHTAVLFCLPVCNKAETPARKKKDIKTNSIGTVPWAEEVGRGGAEPAGQIDRNHYFPPRGAQSAVRAGACKEQPAPEAPEAPEVGTDKRTKTDQSSSL